MVLWLLGFGLHVLGALMYLLLAVAMTFLVLSLVYERRGVV